MQKLSRIPRSFKSNENVNNKSKSHNKKYQEVLKPRNSDGKLIFSNQQINNISLIVITKGVFGLLLDYTNITTLRGLVNYSEITFIDLSYSKFSTLLFWPSFPLLGSINVKGTPFAEHVRHRLALILANNKNLKFIDNIKIRVEERKRASTYPEDCHRLVLFGWMPPALPPTESEMDSLVEEYFPEEFRKSNNVILNEDVQDEKKIRTISQREYLDGILAQQEKRILELENQIQELENQ